MANATKAQTAKSVLGQMAAQVKMTKMPEPPKPSKKNGMPMATPDSSYPPDLYLTSEQAPFIADWKAGETVTLLIQATVQSLNTSEREKGKRHTSVSLRITKAAGGPGK